MQLKNIWEKLTSQKPQKKYHTVPVQTRTFYNSILTADVFEKQKPEMLYR